MDVSHTCSTVTDPAWRPCGLFAFPFVFWLTSLKAPFHLNFMEMIQVLNDPSQNLGTCWLSSFQAA